MADTAGRLAGQIAVVTGGGRGIGAAISRRLAELGASVVLCGRTAASLEETAKSIVQAGNRAEASPCDVVDHRALAEVARTVRSKYGRLDVLVNNAGVGAFAAPLHEFPLEDWDRILNTNLRGVFYAIRA